MVTMALLIRRGQGVTGTPEKSEAAAGLTDTATDPGALVDRLYRSRGVRQPDEIDVPLSSLEPPDSLLGLDAAVTLLVEHLSGCILIIGDFDADGATSSALMVEGLRQMGATNVDYLVPDRFEYGYGLTPGIVGVALASEPDLIVTVDNGISSVDGVTMARDAGVDVLITDHHLPGSELPPASAIVNPNQQGCEFPWKSTAGVGVAFYVLSGLRRRLRELGRFEAQREPNLGTLLDLVALGTIADVVPLERNNRVLVTEGLRRIRAGRARPGIRALAAFANKPSKDLSAMDLGFTLGPRLNAAGRLESMSLGIECLLARDEQTATVMAARLNELNAERRAIEQQMKEQAEDALMLHREYLDAAMLPVGVCLYHDDWHQGVVGIVASRIKDRVNRPVIAFARVADDEIKGSGRSIPGLHIRDALEAIATRYPGILTRFGGHAMAAGMSMAPENYERFRIAFDEEARRWLTEQDLADVVVTDGEIDEELTVPLAKSIHTAGPWGQGFPQPLFDGEFDITSQHIIGERHLRLRLKVAATGQKVEGIAFNHNRLLPKKRVRLAYRLDVNYYQGMETAQIIVEEVDVSEPTLR